MKFDRNEDIMYEEDLAWLDCRMIAFKHNLMNSRLLYWDIIGSKQIVKEERREIHNHLISYMDNLELIHPKDVMEFDLSDNFKELKGDYYKRRFWCIQGDGMIIGLTPNSNAEEIVDNLQELVLGKHKARTAIGYYTGGNGLVLPDYEMYVLDFPYFKNQMEIGIINDTKPTLEQIDEYYEKNYEKVMKMELVNKNHIYNGK